MNIKSDAKFTFYAKRQENMNNSIFSYEMMFIGNLIDYVILFMHMDSLRSGFLPLSKFPQSYFKDGK